MNQRILKNMGQIQLCVCWEEGGEGVGRGAGNYILHGKARDRVPKVFVNRRCTMCGVGAAKFLCPLRETGWGW